LKRLGATRADTACSDTRSRADLRDFDAVHRLRTALRDAGYAAPQPCTRWRDIAPAVWVGHERTMCPDMRLGLPGRGWAPTASAPSTAERWNCRRLRRQAQLRLKFGDPRDERLDPATSAAIKAFSRQIRRRCHPKVTQFAMFRATKKYSP